MSTDHGSSTRQHIAPPSRHQLALMIWIAVVPTLTVLNLTIGAALKDAPVVVRTFVVATLAVPVVIYGVMSHLHRLRTRIITTRSRSGISSGTTAPRTHRQGEDA